MASRYVQREVRGHQDASDTHLLRDPSFITLSALSHSASWWTDREEQRDHGDSLREQLKEMDEHVARLQDMLKCERTKCSRLQMRCNQQEVELRRKEQNCNRLKERLSQFTDRHRDKGPSIEVLNFLPGVYGKRQQPVKSVRSKANKQEEAALRLMLERREAELREAMKLRHSLTTLLHALRGNMQQVRKDRSRPSNNDIQDEAQTLDRELDETEAALGDHVTGGVVQSWRKVQRDCAKIISEGKTHVGTDQDKLLTQLETELKQSQQLVQLQQHLLQDSLGSAVPCELADSYFLEEWDRLQARWAELDNHRRTFEKERQAFTDAAIRLSHERQDFEQQKASFIKHQYLCDSPLFVEAAQTGDNRTDVAALNFSGFGMSGCLPISPSSTASGTTVDSGLNQRKVTFPTPSTPELYSALNLSYNCRVNEDDHMSETWDSGTDRIVHTPHTPPLDLSF
ncbi:afadin- and alpha-actinin-binding protein [Sphaeramia orbicularis]|uniref:afadin- and alpha-actinin-binding protein n=1 Tax=Sphaeramia orbicularis TaxID=375764 RepID=UPI00117F911C|nr:afadin- and alpha-actinin-binding protein-like [Sphaeramia orbicularis]